MGIAERIRKGAVALGMSLVLAGALVPVIGLVSNAQAEAATNAAATAALNNIKKQAGSIPGQCGWKSWNPYPSGWTNCKAGCWYFMANVEKKLVGCYPSGTSGYKLTNPGNFNTVGTVTDSPTANPSSSALQTLMKKAYPGDVIQFKGGPSGWGSYQHTAIVEAVDDSGITIFQHGDSSHVTSTKYTWTYFYNTYLDFDAWTSYTKGITLYHYKDYASKFPTSTPSTPTVTPPDSSHRNGTVTTVPDGVYTISVSYDTGYSVDVPSASKNNSASIQLYMTNGTVAQQFKFTRNSDGTYTIANTNSGKVLDVSNSSLLNHGDIIQFDSHGGDNQKWYVERCSDGSYAFRNKKSNLYMDVYGGTLANGSNITQYQGNSSLAQKFYLMPASGGPLMEGQTWNASGIASQYSLTGDSVTPKPVVEKLIYAKGVLSASDNGKAASWDYCYGKTCALTEGKTYRVEVGAVKKLAGSAEQGTVMSYDFTNNKTVSEWLTVKVSGSAQSVTIRPTADSTLLFYTNYPGGGKGNATEFDNIKVYEILSEGSDYTLSYAGNTQAGTGTVTVALKNYAASTTKSYTVVDERPAAVEPDPVEPGDDDDENAVEIEVPSRPSIKTATPAKKAMKVSWKLDDYADGFQVAVATNSSFTNGKKTVTTSKKSVTVKSLKAKKKYYVKVRAYVEEDGVKYYSGWSKVKIVKTK